MKSVRKSAIAVLAAVLLCLATVAGQEKKGQPEAGAMPIAKPGPEMQKLNFQLGTWKAEEKHEASQGFEGGPGRGVITAKPGPGGLSIITEYKGTGPLGSFTGHGIVLWDAEEKAYKSYWVDNFTAGAMVMNGQWEGKDLVFTGEMKYMGQTLSFKQVLTDITPTSYTMKMFMSDKGAMAQVFTLKATKQ